MRSTEKRIACSATPTIAAQSQRLLPISALKIHRASDEHSGENLSAVREMCGRLQASHCKCASELSPKETRPLSLIFASCSPERSARRFQLRARHSRYMHFNAFMMLRTRSNRGAIGASIPQLPGLLSRANEQSDSRGGLASEPTHSNRRGLRRRRCGDGKEYTSGD